MRKSVHIFCSDTIYYLQVCLNFTLCQKEVDSLDDFLQFYRVYMGTADEVDDRFRARGATVSMYGEALGTADNGDGQKQKDVYVENEELKEGNIIHV